jgi:hypothetical protein
MSNALSRSAADAGVVVAMEARIEEPNRLRRVMSKEGPGVMLSLKIRIE